MTADTLQTPAGYSFEHSDEAFAGYPTIYAHDLPAVFVLADELEPPRVETYRLTGDLSDVDYCASTTVSRGWDDALIGAMHRAGCQISLDEVRVLLQAVRS